MATFVKNSLSMMHSKQITVKRYFKWQIFFCIILPFCDLHCHLFLEYPCFSYKIKNSGLELLSLWTSALETGSAWRVFVDRSGKADGNQYWSSPAAFCGKSSLKYGSFTAFLKTEGLWIHGGSSHDRLEWGTCHPSLQMLHPQFCELPQELRLEFLWK